MTTSLLLLGEIPLWLLLLLLLRALLLPILGVFFQERGQSPLEMPK